LGAQVEPIEVELDTPHKASGLTVVPGLHPARDAEIIQVERSSFLDTGNGIWVEVVVGIVVLDGERSALVFPSPADVRADVKHERNQRGGLQAWTPMILSQSVACW